MIDFAKLLERQIAAEARARAEYSALVLNPQVGAALDRWLERRENHIGQLRDELDKERS